MIAKASGGVFTDKFTHEFQVLTDVGEDTIYWKEGDIEAINEEVLEGKKEDYKSSKAIEVGNIFPLGTFYSERMRAYFTDTDGGKKPIWFGSYGIGPTRVMGTWVEVSHDDRGIIWSKQIAPYDVHLVGLGGKGDEVYKKLIEKGIDVLFDDRDVSAGEKFGDSDLIGVPTRLVVSDRNGDKIEWKERTSDKSELLSLEEVVKKLK